MNALAGPLYIVTGVFVVAGFAKTIRPSATATALAAIRVPSALRVARAMGVAEIIIGVAALATGHWFAWALIAVAYAGFTMFVLWALQAESNVGSCGCFGADDTPPTPGHAAFNAAATAIALLAATDPVRMADFGGSTYELIGLIVVVAIGTTLAVLALTSLPRVLALANGTSAPMVPEFTMRTAARKAL